MEDAGVDFDFFDAGAVELAEGRDDAGLFTGAGGAVYEEVGEVAGVGLGGVRWEVCSEVENIREPLTWRTVHRAIV